MRRAIDSLEAEELGHNKKPGSRYTDDDDAYITESYYKIPLKEMADRLGRTPNSVKIRASLIGITRRRGHNVKAGNPRPSMIEEAPLVEEVRLTPEAIFDAMVGSRMWSTGEQIVAYERAMVARANEILGGADA